MPPATSAANSDAAVRSTPPSPVPVNVAIGPYQFTADGTPVPTYTASNLPTGPAPTIASFTASSPTIAVGGSTTLNWAGSGASYYIVSPSVGAVRGNSITVSPMVTTTYTLYATNQFGRQTATVTVTVQ